MENNVIFQFNNVGKSYLLLKMFDGEKVKRIGYIEINKSETEDDLPIYDDLVFELNRFLSEKNIERVNAKFVLNLKETSKITTVIPNIGDRKIKKIYDNELVNKIGNLDQYSIFSTSNDVDNGKVFYEYITEKRFVEYFNKLGKDLGFQNVVVDHFYTDIFNHICTDMTSKTFAYFYEEKEIVSLIVSINGVLSAYHSFVSNAENYRIAIAAFIDKHINELEKVDISLIIANKKIDYLQDLNTYIKQYTIGA